MSMTLEKKVVDGVTVRVQYDDGPHDYPYEYDNGWGEFVTFDKSSTLSDRHDYADPDEVMAYAQEKGMVVFNLFKYEHGLVQYRVGASNPFGCPWDSGQVGVVLIYPGEIPDPKKFAEGVCEDVTAWCNGSIYGWTISDREGLQDSCWGYYDSDEALQEGTEAAKSYAVEYRNQKYQRMVDLAAFAMSVDNSPGTVDNSLSNGA